MARESHRWGTLDALRREPERWGATPLFVYGFDDFTRLELDALETVAVHCGADVAVSLPFEPGRLAFKAISGIVAELSQLAASTVTLDAISDHYHPASRATLHRLERGLFEDVSAADAEPAERTVREHSAGGERAEVELAAAGVLQRLRDGTPAGDVAVVFRDPEPYASLIEQVFDAYGIPYSIDRSLPLGHTSIGRGLLALLRCALLDGSADDLLAWLRTPGKLEQPVLADRLEATVRRAGAATAAAARALWEAEHWPLDELDRLRAAGSGAALVAELDRQLQRLFAAPHRRRAPVLAGPELDDARAFRAAHDALRQLHALAEPAGDAPAARRPARARRARSD